MLTSPRLYLSRIVWKPALGKPDDHTKSLVMAKHHGIRPIRLGPEMLRFEKLGRPRQIARRERDRIGTLAIGLHFAALGARLRERLSKLYDRIFTDADECAALAARRLFLM